MSSVAYVLLPFAETAPGEAIRASLAGFQGGRGEVPDGWLTFHDETEAVRRAHEARFTFTEQGKGGLRIEGGDAWCVDTRQIRNELQRRGLECWSVRFADAMGLDTFFDRYGDRLERHPATGGFGLWRNPLGRWDW